MRKLSATTLFLVYFFSGILGGGASGKVGCESSGFKTEFGDGFILSVACAAPPPPESPERPSGPLTPDRAEQAELQRMAQKVRASKDKIIEADVEKRRVLSSLYSINHRMKRISKEKGQLTDKLFQAQDNVKSIAKVIASLEVEIEKQKSRIRRRLRALYKISGEGYLGILFSRTSARDLDETLRFLRILTEEDYKLILDYRENVAAHLKQKEILKGQVQKLVGIENQIRSQENLLEHEHKTKSNLVAELDKQRTINIKRIRSIRSKSGAEIGSNANQHRNEDYGDELDELLKPSIFERKGHLPPPIAGVVIQDFGMVSDERYKIRLSHKGWRYAAPSGTSVAAVFEGRVVYSDQVDGHGHTVVIDHGDHYYSVYSHIARSKVNLGDTLKAGQSIGVASAGAAGEEDGIYFEIRHFSEPENPAAWIAVDRWKLSYLDQEPKSVPNPAPSLSEGKATRANAQESNL